MRLMKQLLLFAVCMGAQPLYSNSTESVETFGRREASSFEKLKGKQILYVERMQYPQDHHNTATLFIYGEINQSSFRPGSALKIYDVDSGVSRTLVDCPEGVVRDPELSYDGERIVFSMRNNIEESYNIYEIGVNGENLRQLTASAIASDIDPVYLPSGEIIFSSTRHPKYCMCNRHIMANLFKMEADGANIHQIGFSTLFEGHATVMDDGRIMYDRWEYVDRNFGDAQGLWVVNPDGTKHSIYYGNNMKSPGGVIDARQIPGTDLIVCIFSSCHDRPWGALAVVDRKLGVDGEAPVMAIMPEASRKLIDNGNWDAFRGIEYRVEDPWVLSTTEFLVSGNTRPLPAVNQLKKHVSHSAIFYFNTATGGRDLILESENPQLSLFDPMVIEPRPMPNNIPSMVDHSKDEGTFYVQNVYEGTHMEGVEMGSVKYLRIVESPEKRTWTKGRWQGQGALYPAVNWHSFEVKRVLGEVEVAEDGSAHFNAPSGAHLYFQLLDKDRKMIQSMRSGVSLMPGEVNGCVGCHEDRLTAPVATTTRSIALRTAAQKRSDWMVEDPKNYSFMEQVQPILDRRCVSCHDFDVDKPEKFVLARDRNMYFNAAYINLNVKRSLKLVGGGPAQIQQAYSWGSHASPLTEIIDENKHHGVKLKLTQQERETLYEWMDINGVYYPTYESSFDNSVAGRSPLTAQEVKALKNLTGIDFAKLATFKRKRLALISFDRPELSPCLYYVRDDKEKYDRVLEIIKSGAKRLEELPRGDVESEMVIHPRLKETLKRYTDWLNTRDESLDKLKTGEKYYD